MGKWLEEKLYKITSLAIVVLLIGLGLLGWGGYISWHASQETPESMATGLVSKSGEVVSGMAVTETKKRRRGGKSTTQYYVLEAQLAGGASEKWRVDYAVGQAMLEPLIGEVVEVKVDASNHNLVYEITTQGKTVLELAAMQKLMHDKEESAGWGVLTCGLVAAVVGGLGFLVHRRLRKKRHIEQTIHVPTPAKVQEG